MEAHLLPGGGVRYDHPSGFYDDCVIAAALAVALGARRRAEPAQVVRYARWR